MDESSALVDALVEFLAVQLGTSPSDLPKQGPWSQSGNTVGGLALRMNVLTIEQVDDIIEAQDGNPNLFGEIAI